jgi:hypothetical protein
MVLDIVCSLLFRRLIEAAGWSYQAWLRSALNAIPERDRGERYYQPFSFGLEDWRCGLN